MENQICRHFDKKEKNTLSVYFTAGYPNLDDTAEIIIALEKSGVDMIEIGIPFSDPVADGPVIQRSSEIALLNGMTLNKLFGQLEKIRESVSIPLLLMGYLNPIMQYGIENFCRKCKSIGIDGTIIPDLPLDIYESDYKEIFEANQLSNIFLITPQTPDARIRQIDRLTTSFIYMVSSSSTTGAKGNVTVTQEAYFSRIKGMNLRSKLIIGFGISDKNSFAKACSYVNGAIIGSAFIKALTEEGTLSQRIKNFVGHIIE